MPCRQALEPVKMSCLLGFSTTVIDGLALFVERRVLVTLFLAECSSSTLLAIITPLALCHGPAPMRSRACTTFGSFSAVPWVLKYARHVRLPAPAAFASDWQCWSAPSRPPRSAPLPSQRW